MGPDFGPGPKITPMLDRAGAQMARVPNGRVPNGRGSQLAGSQMALGPKWPGPKWSGSQMARSQMARSQMVRVPNGPPNGVRKTWFCGGMVSKMEIKGFPVTQMDCMVPRRPLGKPVFPQNPFKNCFPRFFPIFGNLGRSPWPPVDLLWALCGPASYPTPDQPPEVAAMFPAERCASRSVAVANPDCKLKHIS